MLTERQKIVVVDDKYEEIHPFLLGLWKNGISFVYLDGLPENLPPKPLLGVRIIFLDIVLGTDGTSEKNQAATVANVVRHIIGEKPDAYFIAFWTKHPELTDMVLKYLKLADLSPVGHLCIAKPKPVNFIEETSAIMEKINTKLLQLGIFNYILQWENIVEKAAHNFSTNLFTNMPVTGEDTNWAKQVSAIMGSLALTYTDRYSLDNTETDIRNTFLMMTDSFRDSLQQTIKSQPLNLHTKLSNDPIDLEQLSKINSSLFIDFNPEKKPSFGNVYIDQDHEQHFSEILKNSIFPNNNKPDDIDVAGMVITPACDLVHKKYLHNDKSCFRILFGLLVPFKNHSELMKHMKPEWLESKKDNLIEELKAKNSDQKFINIVNRYFQGNISQQALFLTSPFWHNRKNCTCLLIFHFGSLTSLWWDQGEIPKFEFALKEHLAFDIQSKMANHANRLGNSMLQFRE